MQVFHDKQDGLPCYLGEQHSEKRFQGLLALPLRREREGRIEVVRQRQCDQGCQERHRLGQHQAVLRQGGFQLAELLLRCITWLPAQGTLEQLGYRIQGGMLIIGQCATL